MKSTTKFLLMTLAALALVAMSVSGTVMAQDLSDPETCLECHADMDRSEPANPDIPQVHNPEGGFFVEAHEMWSCTDCHVTVVELPHPDEFVVEEVDCTECHDQMPTQ